MADFSPQATAFKSLGILKRGKREMLIKNKLVLHTSITIATT